VSVNSDYLIGKLALPHSRPSHRDAPSAHSLARDYPGLIAVLTRRTGDPQLASDLLQDAIVTTLAKQGAGALPQEIFAGYVFRTALFHLRNHHRRERGRVSGQDIEALEAENAESPQEASQRDANQLLVRRLLEELGNARDRRVLVKFYFEEREREEICAELQISEAQFARIIHRARARMRQLMERAGYRQSDLLSALLLLAPVLLG
jgi:RNA polymerase sigma-70 factor (ECF subfamily)